MSYEVLKENIESLLSEKQYRVSKVEELAGLKHGNLSNILSGRSKKPSAEILLSISRVFGVTIEDLFKKTDNIIASSPLQLQQLNLFSEIVSYLNYLIELNNISILYSDYISMIQEVFEYISNSHEYEIDKKFIDWYIKHKFNLPK